MVKVTSVDTIKMLLRMCVMMCGETNNCENGVTRMCVMMCGESNKC